MKKETSDCPEFAEILDWIERKQSPASKSRLESHFKKGCSHCEQSIHWAKSITTAIKSNDLMDAPDFMIEKALALFPPKRSSLQEWIRAKLTMDSSLVPAMGVRGENGPRMQTYSTSKHTVHLMLQKGKDVSTVTGQIVPNVESAGISGCLVELLAKKKRVVSTTTNESGEFAISAARLVSELRIHTDGESILIDLPH